MEILGNLIQICQTVDISLKDGGTMQKGGLVIMPQGEYAKPVHLEVMGGERLQQLQGLTQGMPLQVSFYPESREGRDGRYFTSLRCTRVVALAQPQPAAQQGTAQTQPMASQWPAAPVQPPQPTQPQAQPVADKEGLDWLMDGDNDTPF